MLNLQRSKPSCRLLMAQCAAVLLLLSCVVGAAETPKPVGTSQTMPRYALLIGVNDYPPGDTPESRVDPLQGPGNDVELVKKLLVERYGFQNDADHIVTLVGKEATHQSIAANVKKQLIDKAAAHPGAIVLFYFSGHGSQIKDQDGDEGDGYDETLVAYDSRQPAGSDISDDEVNNWLRELNHNTNHVTFILDSCHSESGVRAVGTAVSRSLPPKSGIQSSLAARTLDEANGRTALASARGYVLLAGSLAYESAVEDYVDTAQGKKKYGLFTYYLVQALMQDPQSTYRQAISRVSTALQKPSPNQDPQAEGDLDSHVLNGSGQRDDPFIPIVALLNDGTFEIEAGAIMGLHEGAILAVYEPSAQRLSGDKEKIANARVIKLGAERSRVALSESPRIPMKKDAKVKIVTPFFGLAPLRVDLNDLPGQQTSSQDAQLLSEIRKYLAEGRLGSAAEPGQAAELVIRRGCLTDDFLWRASDTEIPLDCIPAYYLSSPLADSALMGFTVPLSNDNAAREIASRIEMLSRQNNIRNFENAATSRLSGKVRIALIKVNVKVNENGQPLVDYGNEIDSRGVTPMRIGENFLLKVFNDSGEDLRVSVVSLGSSGSVSVVGPNARGDIIAAKGSMIVTRQPWLMQGPLGRESYKAIATTGEGNNLEVIQQPGMARNAADNPLGYFFSMINNGTPRDAGPNPSLSLDDWTTARFDVDIIEAEGADHLPAQELVQGARAVLPQGFKLRTLASGGLEVTKDSEGWVPHLYNDSAKYCTIGYGHLVKKSPCDGSEVPEFLAGLSKAQGELMLVDDMGSAQYSVMTGVRVPMTDGQYAALSDFVFNVGSANFRKSTLLKVVNARQFDQVPGQFRRWTLAGGRPWRGLEIRREREIDLFFEGGPQPKGAPRPDIDLRSVDVGTGEN